MHAIEPECYNECRPDLVNRLLGDCARPAYFDDRYSRDLATSNKRLADVIKGSSMADIKARDRVDISLEHYEELKKEIEIYKARTSYAEEIIRKLGIPVNLIEKIDPDSIEMFTTEDRMIGLSQTYKGYRIEFTIKIEE